MDSNGTWNSNGAGDLKFIPRQGADGIANIMFSGLEINENLILTLVTPKGETYGFTVLNEKNGGASVNTVDYNDLINKPDLNVYQLKEEGKDLSQNDYTDDDKQLVHSALQEETDPTVPSWAKQPNKPSYTPQEVGALPADTPLFSGDYNDLENKPVIPDTSNFVKESDLALVAFSGSYNDLTDTPSSQQVQSDWNQSDSAAIDFIKNKPTNVSAFNNDAGYLTQHQDITGKEDKTNKVTSWQATPDNTHYPSEKLVKDSIDGVKVFIAEYGVTTRAES